MAAPLLRDQVRAREVLLLRTVYLVSAVYFLFVGLPTHARAQPQASTTSSKTHVLA